MRINDYSRIRPKRQLGGKIKGPLTAQPRGEDVAWLTDKFGIDWMVSIDKA